MMWLLWSATEIFTVLEASAHSEEDRYRSKEVGSPTTLEIFQARGPSDRLREL